eukprot:c23780_g1_i1 orf=222-2042(+)
MSGTSVIAGPDVDMAEMEGGVAAAAVAAASSSLSVAGVVDLDLNLGLPVEEGDGLALGLGLGHGVAGDLDLATQVVSRHNWPRFEPGMSGLFPVGHQDGEPISTQDGSHFMPAVNLNSVGSNGRLADRSGRGRYQMRLHHPGSQMVLDAGLPEENGRDRSQQSHPSHSQVRHRFRRLSRQFFRSRQIEGSDMQRTIQIATPFESNTGPRFINPEEFTPSVVIFGAVVRDRDSETATDCLTAPAAVAKDNGSEPNAQAAKDNGCTAQGANFECNICLDLAKEPVVTSCGHLFCWPCLYQWLYVHSYQKECPVCKGHVTDNTITPIYGRGNTQDKRKTIDGQPFDEIPPRPHAHRINSTERWQGRRSSQGERILRDRDDASAARPPGGFGSTTAEPILQRLRVAQRLQRLHLEQRLTLRQRLITRGATVFRSPSVEPQTGDSVRPDGGHDGGSEGLYQSRSFDDREQILTQMAINRLPGADRLALLQARLVASMDGLLDNLSNVRRSAIETEHSSQGHRPASRIVFSDGMVSGQGVPEFAELDLGEEGLSTSASVAAQDDILNREAWLDPSLSHSMQQRRRHDTVAGASSSSDVEPGLLHARKRRRLN